MLMEVSLLDDVVLWSCDQVNQSHYRPEVPRGFQEVKVPKLHDSGTGWW